MKHFFYLTILLMCCSCQKENWGDCFKSTGKTTTEDRDVSAFHSIDASDRINVVIRKADQHRLQVRAGENLQSLIKTKVENQVLTIANDNTCNWVRSFKREITVLVEMPDIRSIALRGSGIIRMEDTMDVDELLVESHDGSGEIFVKANANQLLLKCHTGPTDIYCEGQTNDLVLFMGADGIIDASQVQTPLVFAINQNRGRIFLHTDGILRAEIGNFGDIFYSGSPSEIRLDDRGDGELIKR